MPKCAQVRWSILWSWMEYQGRPFRITSLLSTSLGNGYSGVQGGPRKLFSGKNISYLGWKANLSLAITCMNLLHSRSTLLRLAGLLTAFLFLAVNQDWRILLDFNRLLWLLLLLLDGKNNCLLSLLANLRKKLMKTNRKERLAGIIWLTWIGF